MAVPICTNLLSTKHLGGPMLQVAHQEGHYLGKLFRKHHLTPGEGKRLMQINSTRCALTYK